LEWAKESVMMSKKWIVVVLVFMLICFGFSIQSIADCKSDCEEEYASAVESCKTLYDDPDDANELQTCMENAKSEYDSCIDECEN
jgi:uncharacterized membrane protein